MSNHPSVCILGASLPSGNMGVQALATSLITLLERVCPGIETTILCGGPCGTRTENVYVGRGYKSVTVCNYRMSPRAKWSEHLLLLLFAAALYRALPLADFRRRLLVVFPILHRMVNATFVGDIRGGDSFSDIYGAWNFVTGNLPCLIALLLGKDLVLLPQTYGPFKTRLARSVARLIVRRAKFVLARDEASLAVVSQWLARKGRCSKPQLCPDVAFSLEPSMPAEPGIEPPLSNGSDDLLIGFNVSGLLYHGGFNQGNMFGLRDNYQETAFQVLQFLLRLPNTRVLLLPHMMRFDRWYIESDIHASRHLLDRLDPGLRSRVHLAVGDYDQHQVKTLIGRCGFFIGSRMHSCIAALSQGIPTVGIAYSRKFVGVFETVGVPEAALDATRLNLEEMIQQIQALHARAGQTQELLASRVPEARAITLACFKNWLGMPEDKIPEHPCAVNKQETADAAVRTILQSASTDVT